MTSKLVIVFCCFIFFLSCQRPVSLESEKDTEGRWYVQRTAQENSRYYGIIFTDEQNGWLTASDGLIEHTTDGGQNWSNQKSNVKVDLWDVDFVDRNTGWVCGDSNTILKTIDGGKTWNNISPECTESKLFVDIDFINESIGWASRNQGEVIKTIDGGESWEVKFIFPYGGGAYSKVFDENTAYFINRKKLYRTFNGGISWDSLAIDIPQYYMHAPGIYFSDPQHGWIPTWNGTGGMMITQFPVVMTVDGGLTWTVSDSLPEFGLNCIYFIDNTHGWLATAKTIYRTKDGGKSWQAEFEIFGNSFFSAQEIYFINENSGWLLNNDGTIFKYEKP